GSGAGRGPTTGCGEAPSLHAFPRGLLRRPRLGDGGPGVGQRQARHRDVSAYGRPVTPSPDACLLRRTTLGAAFGSEKGATEGQRPDRAIECPGPHTQFRRGRLMPRLQLASWALALSLLCPALALGQTGADLI